MTEFNWLQFIANAGGPTIIGAIALFIVREIVMKIFPRMLDCIEANAQHLQALEEVMHSRTRFFEQLLEQQRRTSAIEQELLEVLKRINGKTTR
jgi:hypothetical protein